MTEKIKTACRACHGGIPSLRSKAPYPRVEIHPGTAAKYGIEDGDYAFVI